MSTSASARVLIIGRSAAERSAVARAFHHAGLQPESYARAADLTPALLARIDLVIALDQHAYLQRRLAQSATPSHAPLLLPIDRGTSDDAPSSQTATQDVPSSHADADPDAPAPHPPTGGGLDPAWIAHARSLATQKPAENVASLRKHLDALADHIARLPTHVAAPAEGTAPPTRDERTVEVRDIYEVMPEHDPRHQDPGPLPELETPKSTAYVVFFAVLVGLAAAAYLLLAPPTERELEEERRAQADAAASIAMQRAADVTYAARAVATRSPLDLSREPVSCRRLVEEGRIERAKQVCGRAYLHDGAAAAPLARVLMQSHAAHDALRILEERVEHRPEDIEAWELLATAAEQVGDQQIERRALKRLITLYEQRDPVSPLRERLRALPEDASLESTEDPADDPADEASED